VLKASEFIAVVRWAESAVLVTVVVGFQKKTKKEKNQKKTWASDSPLPTPSSLAEKEKKRKKGGTWRVAAGDGVAASYRLPCENVSERIEQQRWLCEKSGHLSYRSVQVNHAVSSSSRALR
jgi:hypothetical protein